MDLSAAFIMDISSLDGKSIFFVRTILIKTHINDNNYKYFVIDSYFHLLKEDL